MLSATDYDLIQQWESRGIPVNIVCRGIENGVAEFATQRQSSRMGLSYLKVYVEEEMERSRV